MSRTTFDTLRDEPHTFTLTEALRVTALLFVRSNEVILSENEGSWRMEDSTFLDVYQLNQGILLRRSIAKYLLI